jgi:hypothetical protein
MYVDMADRYSRQCLSFRTVFLNLCSLAQYCQRLIGSDHIGALPETLNKATSHMGWDLTKINPMPSYPTCPPRGYGCAKDFVWATGVGWHQFFMATIEIASSLALPSHRGYITTLL